MVKGPFSLLPHAQDELVCLPQDELVCLPQDKLVCLPQNELVCVPQDELACLPRDEGKKMPFHISEVEGREAYRSAEVQEFLARFGVRNKQDPEITISSSEVVFGRRIEDPLPHL